MKKKLRAIVLLSVVILAAALATAIAVIGNRESETILVTEQEKNAAFDLLNESLNFPISRYQDYLAGLDFVYGLKNETADVVTGEDAEGYGKAIRLDYDELATYLIEIDEAGVYSLGIDYCTSGTNLSDYKVSLRINGVSFFDEMDMVVLPLLWTDTTKDFPKDRYGDETAPEPRRIDGWRYRDVYNSAYYTSEPLFFYLEKGRNEICIRNVSADGLMLGRLYVNPASEPIESYDEYRLNNVGEMADDYIEIQGIDYSVKNSSSVFMSSANNPAMGRYDNEYKKLNNVSWYLSGVEVDYDITVEETGYYHLALHYKNDKEDFQVFETIRIDGKVPFSEMKNYGFNSTNTAWKNEVLSSSDGNPYEFFLTKGQHTITVRAEVEPMTRQWRYARLICEHVTQFALEIKKITGETVNKNRTWSMTKYIPEIADYLNAYATLIRWIQQESCAYSDNGYNSVQLDNLNRALELIEKISEYPDEIPLYLDNLTGSSSGNSILKVVGDFSAEIMSQPFAIDRIYIYGNKTIPNESVGFFNSVANGFMSLMHTFTSEKYKTATADEDAITIWVNRSLTQVDLLQRMADTEFTEKYGIKVNISVMPDANKLTLSAAAGETPDMALGIASSFDLAYRETLYDLTKFDDFWEYADSVPPGTLVPYNYNEGIYGFPETTNFSLVIYRTDIFEQLGMQVPSTWDDLRGILPKLQRYGMSFYHDIATNGGYKYFYQTVPMLYQNGGKLYSDNGLHTAINEPEAVKGIAALGELFSIYSIPTKVASFMDSFRYNLCPIGIVNLDTYILVKNGAKELEGQWALAPYLGTVRENGSIDRSYIAGSTCGIVFKNTDKANECWEFMKWWMSHETQSRYAYTLQLSFGDDYVWLSANKNALADSTIRVEDRRLILEQLSHLKNVPRTPGDYMLERDLSNIWNSIAMNGASAQVAIDAKIQEINRELLKKMSDIGFTDAEGNVLREYTIHDVDWIIENVMANRQSERCDTK